MNLKEVSNSKLLGDLQVVELLAAALAERRPLSLVRIGDGENIVLAQGVLMDLAELSELRFVQYPAAYGISLPCPEFRDQMVESTRRADIVGVLHRNDGMGIPKIRRVLTEQIFDYYRIDPKIVCSAWVSRRVVHHRLFWELLHRYRILLISEWAERFAGAIAGMDPKPNVAGCIPIQHFDDIPAVLEKAGRIKYDLALVSAGLSAVVIAERLAGLYGKVAVDFGKMMAKISGNEVPLP